MIVSDHHDRTCQLSVFFCHEYTPQNMSYFPVLGSFCLVSSRARYHTAQCTHPQEFLCTNTHMNSFIAISDKTSCPGKFPRPQLPNRELWDHACPPFDSFLCFLCSLGLNTRVRTHPHSSTSICTRVCPSLHVYMYDLIEKYYQTDIKFENLNLVTHHM